VAHSPNTAATAEQLGFDSDARVLILNCDDLGMHAAVNVAVLDSIEHGLSPTHLDWHCLGDGGREDILGLGLELADEYGLAARLWLDDGCQKARSMGKPIVDGTWLDSFTVDVEGKAQTYERMLRSLPPGLSEWAVHPGLGTKDWRAIEQVGWRVRQSDHAFLTSPRARDVLAEEGIELIDYIPLQNIWRDPPATS
jgi:chitin disaccharide deacetylase